MRIRFNLLSLITVVVLSPTIGSSGVINLSDVGPGQVSTYTGVSANGVSFSAKKIVVHPTGSGVFNPFLRIQMKGQEAGYNTDAKPPIDAKGGIWTHALQLGDIPVVLLGSDPSLTSSYYYQFLLDINQDDGGGKKGPDVDQISLNQIQIFQSSADVGHDLSGYVAAPNDASGNDARISFPGATQVFKLDAATGADTSSNPRFEIQIDDITGSGSAELAFYVAYDAFNHGPGSAASYITFFSQFGKPPVSSSWESNAGFEEWAYDKGIPKFPDTFPDIDIDNASVPEPASLVVWCVLGLAGIHCRSRRNSA